MQEAHAAHKTLSETSAAYLTSAATAISQHADASASAAAALQDSFAAFQALQDESHGSMHDWLQSAIALVHSLSDNAAERVTAAQRGTCEGGSYADGQGDAVVAAMSQKGPEERLERLLTELKCVAASAASKASAALDEVVAQQAYIQVRLTAIAMKSWFHAPVWLPTNCAPAHTWM
jgi:hypothetical protein